MAAIPRRRFWFGLGAFGLCAVTLLLTWYVLADRVPPLPVGIDRDEYRQTLRELRGQGSQVPDHEAVLCQLGEKAAGAGRWEAAFRCFDQIPAQHPRYGHLVVYEKGQILIQQQRLTEAEANLREFLRLEQLAPQMKREYSVVTKQYLSYLLAVELRFEERQQLLSEMIQRGEAQTFEVLAWCFPTLLEWNSPHAAWRVEQAWQIDPAKVRLGVALARYRIGQGRLQESRLILARCLELSPHDLDAKAALFAYHLEQNAWSEMALLIADLPPIQDSEPWLLLKMRGHFHEHQQRYPEAIDCYRRALRVDPASAESQLGLARALAATGAEHENQKALAASQGLARIQNRLGWSVQNPDRIEPLLEIAQICEQINLLQQGWLVTGVALRKAPNHQELLQLKARLVQEHKEREHQERVPRPEASNGH